MNSIRSHWLSTQALHIVGMRYGYRSSSSTSNSRVFTSYLMDVLSSVYGVMICGSLHWLLIVIICYRGARFRHKEIGLSHIEVIAVWRGKSLLIVAVEVFTKLFITNGCTLLIIFSLWLSCNFTVVISDRVVLTAFSILVVGSWLWNSWRSVLWLDMLLLCWISGECSVLLLWLLWLVVLLNLDMLHLFVQVLRDHLEHFSISLSCWLIPNSANNLLN